MNSLNQTQASLFQKRDLKRWETSHFHSKTGDNCLTCLLGWAGATKRKNQRLMVLISQTTRTGSKKAMLPNLTIKLGVGLAGPSALLPLSRVWLIFQALTKSWWNTPSSSWSTVTKKTMHVEAAGCMKDSSTSVKMEYSRRRTTSSFHMPVTLAQQGLMILETRVTWKILATRSTMEGPMLSLESSFRINQYLWE